jgi:hypothetical protein
MALSEAEMRDLQDFMAARREVASQGSFDMEKELGLFELQRDALSEARVLRKEGNALLSMADDVEGARRKYSEALELVAGQAEVATSATRGASHACLLGLAVCDMKQGQNDAARELCTSILEDGPAPRMRVMGLTRRARAALRMDDLDAALVRPLPPQHSA